MSKRQRAPQPNLRLQLLSGINSNPMRFVAQKSTGEPGPTVVSHGRQRSELRSLLHQSMGDVPTRPGRTRAESAQDNKYFRELQERVRISEEKAKSGSESGR
jgi:hypothetical protein